MKKFNDLFVETVTEGTKKFYEAETWQNDQLWRVKFDYDWDYESHEYAEGGYVIDTWTERVYEVLPESLQITCYDEDDFQTTPYISDVDRVALATAIEEYMNERQDEF